MGWFLVIINLSGGLAILPTPYPNDQACHVAFERSASEPETRRSLGHLCIPAP